MNSDITRPDETGYLPATKAEWPDAIVKLATDVNLRARMGTAARQIVEAEFSVTRARDVWRKILND